MLALLDERTIPQAGWLDRVRAAARRHELAVGGSFVADRRSTRRLAAYLAWWWTWRPSAPTTYTEDHPPTNIALRVHGVRRLGGFAQPATLLRRLSGFGARPVRFDPSMHVSFSEHTTATSLPETFRNGRLTAGALVRAYDNRRRLRFLRVLITPVHCLAHLARIVVVNTRDHEVSAQFVRAFPRTVLNVVAYDAGAIAGYIRPPFARLRVPADGTVPTSAATASVPTIGT
jgi:hypothetical protein